MIGRIYCAIRRYFGKRHRYMADPDGGHSCVYCSRPKRKRKAKGA